MEMEKKYKMLFFKFIYYYLHLENVENDFKNNGILSLDTSSIDVIKDSLYFSLLNSIDISKLTLNEQEYLKKIDLNDLNSEIINYILSTYEKVLLKKDLNEFIYYGEMSEMYKVPCDCVALGFYYDKYGLACGNRLTLDQVNSNEKKIYNTFNYLQFNANSKIKVAFVLYNELYKKIPDRFFK